MSVANILKTPIVAPAITDPYANGGGGSSGVTSLNSATGALNIVGAGGTTVTTVGSTITVTGGGAPPGLYLPLVGGTMTDSAPSVGAPIHNVALIDGLYNIYGPPVAGNTLSINAGPTSSGGNDIQIQAPGNAIYEDAYQIENTATNEIINDAGIREVIHNRLKVSPNPGTIVYTANDYGVDIGSYTNPTQDETGLHVHDIKAQTNVWGEKIENINSVVNNAFGLLTSDVTANNALAVGVGIQNIGGINANGILLENVKGQDDATGEVINNVFCTAGPATGIVVQTIHNQASGYDAKGIRVNDVVTEVNGDAYGMSIDTITATLGTARGIRVNTISAPDSGFQAIGVDTEDITGETVIGLRSAGIQAYNQAYGEWIQKVHGKNGAYGIYMDDVAADSVGDAYGISMTQIKGIDNVYGLFAQKLTADTGSGVYVNQVYTKNRANGVNAIDIHSDTAQSYGINSESIVSEGNDAIGFFLNKVFSHAPGYSAQGMGFQSIGDGTADVTAFGINGYGITADNATADATGSKFDTITGRTVRGYDVRNITGDQTAFGVYVENVNANNSDAMGQFISGVYGFYSKGQFIRDIHSKDVATGQLIEGIVSDTNDVYGSIISDVRSAVPARNIGQQINGVGDAGSPSGNASGIEIQKIYSKDVTVGVSITDINSTANQTIGVSLTNAVGDAVMYGSYQFDNRATNGSAYGYYTERILGGAESYGFMTAAQRSKLDARGFTVKSIDSDAGDTRGARPINP